MHIYSVAWVIVQVIQEFISGLETYIEDPERFRNCLLPCVPAAQQDNKYSNMLFFYKKSPKMLFDVILFTSCFSPNISSGSYQESLVRLLLGIEMLQVKLSQHTCQI